MQVFATKKSPQPFVTGVLPDEPAFAEFLEDAARSLVNGKDSNQLSSPTVFIPNIPGVATKRGTHNVAYIDNVWLDNDYSDEFGTGIAPEKFAAMFPDLRMYICNTYNNHNESRRKYRVVIPTTTRMTPDLHTFAIEEITKRLRSFGYESSTFFARAAKEGTLHACRFDGFDVSKFGATSLFFLPCQSVNGPQHSYFKKLNPSGGAIDLAHWIDGYVPPLPVTKPLVAPIPATATIHSINPTSQSLRKAHAVQAWRDCGRGNGHAAFFRLGGALANAGFPEPDVSETLYEEADNARSPQERRGEVQSVLRRIFRH